MTKLFTAAVIESINKKPSLPVFLDPLTLPTLTLVIAQEYNEDRHAGVLSKQILRHSAYPEENVHVTHFYSLFWASRFCTDNLSMQKPLIIGDCLTSVRSFSMDAEVHLRELRHNLKVTNRKMIILMSGFTKQWNLLRQADSVIQLVAMHDCFAKAEPSDTFYGLCCRKWRGKLNLPYYYSFLNDFK
jgi:hypothetical protein